MEEEVITRQALGRIAALGELYDAHKDSFCGHSIFSKNIDEFIKITDTEKTQIEHNFENTLNAKLSKFNVEAELKGSFLAGLVKIEAGGHGQYLTSSSSNVKETSASLICRMLTKYESVNISNRSLISDISFDAIKNSPNATHIVTAIQWGAGATVELIYKHESDESQQEIKGSLKAAFQKFTLGIKAKGKLECTGENSNTLEKFQLKFFVDSLPKGEGIPETVEEAKIFMKKIPTLIENANGGKGIPQIYTMIPINSLKFFFKKTEFCDRIIHRVDENVIEEAIEIFDEIAENLNAVNNIYAEFKEYSYCLKDEILSDIYNKIKSIKSAQNALKNDLYHTLIEIRYGRKDVSMLVDLLQKQQKCDEIQQTMLYCNSDTMRTYKEKVMLAKCMKTKSILYIGKGTSLEAERMKHNISEFYAFYCDWMNIENRTDNLNLFMDLNPDKTKLFIDVEVNPAERKSLPSGNRICCYFKGRFIDSDYLQTWKQEVSKNYAKCKIKRTSDNKNYISLTKVYFRCPLSYKQNQCDNSEYQWYCYECDEILQYDNNTNFYCRCGIASIEGFEYRCHHDKHGEKFVECGQMQILFDKCRGTESTILNGFDAYQILPTYTISLQNAKEDNELLNSLKTALMNLYVEREALLKKLYVQRYGILHEKLVYPRIVCASSTCYERKQLPLSNLRYIVFKINCFDSCSYCIEGTCNGIQLFGDSTDNSMTYQKWEGNCYLCKCSWQSHIHITYTQRAFTETTEDVNVKILLTEKQKAIEELKKRISDNGFTWTTCKDKATPICNPETTWQTFEDEVTPVCSAVTFTKTIYRPVSLPTL